MSTHTVTTSTVRAIPCYRCGSPLAHGVAELVAAMATGTVSATKAYYVHGSEEGGYTCGPVIVPGADKSPAINAPFRRAVKAAMNGALAGEGYARILHVPAPVKLGSPEEGVARARSAEVQARLDGKGKGSGVAPTALATGCMFYLGGSGEWVMGLEPVTVPAVPVAPTVPSAPAPTLPPPPAPPVAPTAPMAPPPPPPAPMAYVALTDGTVAHVTVTVARSMLADGRAYSVNVGGAWVAAFP
jgi:hypothetical protein